MIITFETVIVAGIAMGAATGVVGLVGYDLMHSPTPHSRYIEAGAAPGRASGATVEHASPKSVDRSVEAVERQARVVHDFTNLTIFRIVTTWLDGREYRVTSGYIYQSIHSDMPEKQFCYLMCTQGRLHVPAHRPGRQSQPWRRGNVVFGRTGCRERRAFA